MVTVSANGARLSVAASGVADVLSPQATPADSALVVFEVRDGKAATLLGKVPLPAIPATVVDTGNRILVGFIGADPAVIDPSKVSSGGSAIIGRIPVRAGLLVGLRPDGRTLFALGAGLFAIVDLDRVPVQPMASQTAAK